MNKWIVLEGKALGKFNISKNAVNVIILDFKLFLKRKYSAESRNSIHIK